MREKDGRFSGDGRREGFRESEDDATGMRVLGWPGGRFVRYLGATLAA